MFSFFKNKSTKSENKLFLLNLHVGRGTNTEMPSNLNGAYVSVFVTAKNHKTAAEKAILNISQKGYVFIDIVDKQIHQLDPKKWDTYVNNTWPELLSRFPSQNEVLKKLSLETIFFGPFISYEK